MVRQMQIVFPLVAKIQADVIERYGFQGSGPGSVQFIQVGGYEYRAFHLGQDRKGNYFECCLLDEVAGSE